jgi:hypothetical protein
MADLKISQLTGATTPLAGTEVLPIVQSGSTRKVATDDLTVKNVRSNATTGILQIAGPGAGTTRTMTTPNADFTAARIDAAQTFTGLQTFSGVGGTNTAFFDSATVKRTTFQQNDSALYININDTLAANGNIFIRSSNTLGTKFTFEGGSGNLINSTGNFVVSTAGKGVTLPGGITWTSGAGSPEGVVTAPIGSLYSRSDGGLLTSLYVKESGSGNTGWVGK